MKLYFATDHAGFDLKNELMAYAQDTLGYDTVDCGAYTLDPTDDYPDVMQKATMSLKEDRRAKAIVFGGSGQGEAMYANRFPWVRATVWYGGSMDVLRHSRKDNDANVLSIGARFVTISEAQEALQTWLETDFSEEERHVRRIEKLGTVDI